MMSSSLNMMIVKHWTFDSTIFNNDFHDFHESRLFWLGFRPDFMESIGLPGRIPESQGEHNKILHDDYMI